MEESGSSPDGINSMDYMNKKRKLQDELLEMPLPKYVCWDRGLECESSSRSTTKPMNLGGGKFARTRESDLDSAKDSNSFEFNADSAMSTDDQAIRTSDEPSTSSMSWDVTSTEISLYSLESRSLTKSGSSESEPLSINEQHNCPIHHQGLRLSLNYDGHLLELGSYSHCSCSGYKNSQAEQEMDEELEDLLHSNGMGITPSNYVLSSGRWSVNQDSQNGGNKLTIDKEFEQYFSMLML